MTIVLNLEGHALDQVSAQLFKLVNVIGIQEMTERNSRQRELLFVKVATDSSSAAQVADLATKFGAKVISQGDKHSLIEAVGTNRELSDLLVALEKFGIKELVQSGVIAVELGDATLTERTAQETGLVSSESHAQTEDYQN